MKVTLLDYTAEADVLLLFTKSTRLGLTPMTMADIIRQKPQEREAGLRYMANTIRSSWEFVSYTFLIEDVSRAFTHQLVRNRHGSYAQQSMRVNDMRGFGFVMPRRIAEKREALCVVHAVNIVIDDAYRQLIELGIPAEDARSILPTNIATNIVARFNLRTFAELAHSRLGGRTQEEYRDVMLLMVDRVLAVHPWAETFLYGSEGRDYFLEIEDFAEREFGGDLAKKGELLKIIDHMRKMA